MDFTLKHDWWKLSTNGVLLALNKLLVMGIAWLFFFQLVLVGWDLDLQQEQDQLRSPVENYEPTLYNTPKGGIEK